MNKTIYQLYLEMLAKIVRETPNNEELGEKVRKLYDELFKDVLEN
jgi:hypothetical protein